MHAWRICLDFGTAYSKAAACPVGADGEGVLTAVRALPIAAASGEASRYLAPCAIFVAEDRVLFGGAALRSARALADQNRAALQSFKNMLGDAAALDGLSLPAPAEVDPARRLTRRHLTVAYLAWLQVQVAAAFSRETLGASWGEATLRITRPAWSLHGPEAGDWLVRRLMDEAETVAQALGQRLSAPDGVAIATLLPALESAAVVGAASRVEACIYEPIAAAALVARGPTSGGAGSGPEEFWLVLDMGAGTTDIAGLVRQGGVLREAPQARVGLARGGDAIDRILIEHALRAAGRQSVARRAVLMRELLAGVRDMKPALFRTGRASVAFDGKSYMLRRADIERDPAFQALRAEIASAWAAAAEGLARTHAPRDRRVRALLAGGGAHLAFVRDIARQSPGALQWRMEVVEAPKLLAGLSPDETDALAQLSIAIGGAILPLSAIAGA